MKPEKREQLTIQAKSSEEFNSVLDSFKNGMLEKIK
jgi:hypothetical protein